VPTFKEQGLMNSDGYTWNSIMVPKGTPKPIIDKLNAEINKALEGPLVSNLIEQAGSTNLKGSTPESTDAFWRNELKTWAPAIQALNIRLD
jgi:tripartite-type tricarboxylate transporter receptor subunit TctC